MSYGTGKPHYSANWFGSEAGRHANVRLRVMGKEQSKSEGRVVMTRIALFRILWWIYEGLSLIGVKV